MESRGTNITASHACDIQQPKLACGQTATLETPMTFPEDWFTEIHDRAGTAFSLRIRARLHEEKTPFQHIEIYDTAHWGRLMVIDGYVMLSSRDNFLYHEMLAHPVLYCHDSPRRVAIIGGGDCGTLREVLRHPEVERVIQIDIDERVTHLAEIHFPALCESNNDPRATLLFDDGIRWIKQADGGKLDIIIIDSTEPIGPGEGLFTEDFYRDCLRALDSGGILIQQSESPMLDMPILTDMRDAMQTAGFERLHTLFFPQPIYPSGWWSATAARKQGDFSDFREQDVIDRPFETHYYNEATHRAAMATPEFFRDKTGQR